MEERTHGIVLRKVRYNDTGMIVDVFTATRGTLSFLAKGGGRDKSRTAALTPLAIVEVGFRWRQQRSLQRLDDVHTAWPYTTLGTDPAKMAMGMFLQEFLYHALKHEVANRPLYDYVSTALRWLDRGRGGMANFHLAFVIHLTRYLGLWPSMERWHEGCIFDLKEGEMADSVPAHRFWLSPEDTARLPHIMRMTFRSMRLFRLNRMQRNVILDAAIAYYRLHVPEFPELKSVEVLREMYQ